MAEARACASSVLVVGAAAFNGAGLSLERAPR